MTAYQQIIVETLNVTPNRARLVEAYLRLSHSTLDSLSRADIYKEYREDLSDTIDEDIETAIKLAESYGL